VRTLSVDEATRMIERIERALAAGDIWLIPQLRERIQRMNATCAQVAADHEQKIADYLRKGRQ